jgi:hypothetical protein
LGIDADIPQEPVEQGMGIEIHDCPRIEREGEEKS